MIKYKPDIVHTHMAKAGTLGRIAAIITFRKCIVHTYHGHIFDGYFSPLKTIFFLFIERILSKFSDKLISVSNYQREEFVKLKLGDYKKIVNIPLGLKIEEFQGLDKYKDYKNELGIKKNDIVITIVARIVPIKNHKLLVDTVNLLKNKFTEFKILIVGDGSEKKYLKQYIDKLTLKKYFVWTGFTKELAKIYAVSDIVVLTSKNEGLPTVIIESQFCKVPVVSTDVGGVRDLIEHNKTGLLTEPDNPEDLCGKLLELINNKEKRVELGLNGYKNALQKYTVEALTEKFKKFYNKLLNK
jgi:glycosyltransferase involved in cell wall biosynthesis